MRNIVQGEQGQLTVAEPQCGESRVIEHARDAENASLVDAQGRTATALSRPSDRVSGRVEEAPGAYAKAATENPSLAERFFAQYTSTGLRSLDPVSLEEGAIYLIEARPMKAATRTATAPPRAAHMAISP